MRAYSIIVSALVLAACGGGSDAPASVRSSPSAPLASPGGFWTGTDTGSDEVTAIVAEDGLFYLLDGEFSKSSGILTVSSGDSVSGILLIPQEPGTTSADGTVDTDCSLAGTLVERQSLILEVKCKQEEGQQVLTTLTLSYDTLYERDSSIATIAGNFSYNAGNVLNIAANGTLFGQDAATGCVINGDVTVIDSAFNLYEFRMAFSNCAGQNAILNTEVFFGFAALDDSLVPEQLIIAVSDNVDGALVTIVRFAERL